jgi:hypothetical protein
VVDSSVKERSFAVKSLPYPRSVKTPKGRLILIFAPIGPTPPPKKKGAQSRVHVELVKKGVSDKQAQKIDREYDTEFLREKISQFDYVMGLTPRRYVILHRNFCNVW